MTDNRSLRKTDSSVSSETSDDDARTRGSKSRGKSSAKDDKESSRRKRNTNTSLDSNGESEDEEINKLQKIIQDQAKELNEEKQASRKLRQMVKLLKRETKQLQEDKSKKQGEAQQSNNSDSDNPPWERRKLEVRLAEFEKVVREKNDHIEQLLRDCRKMEQENQQCNSQIQELTQPFNECTQQLQIATHNYETLESTFKERTSQLEIENDKTRIQLGECQWQKDKTEENLDKLTEAVDVTINKCKEIIDSKQKTIETLQAKLEIYRSSGLSNREKEIERLRAELATASKEIEESARLMERFQGLHLSDGAKAITSGVKRKLKELETLKATLKENDRLLLEREEQVAELIRVVHRYESGTYGLAEATKELKETREQLKIRDDHIERLIEQLNTLEERMEDVVLENTDLREKYNVDPKLFDLPLKKMTLNQQREAYQQEIQQLKEENMQLGLENRSFKRALLRGGERQPPDVLSTPVSQPNDKLLLDYQKACSEVIVLRKGLIEILHSVRQQDGSSDVKIESPILERLVTVLNSEKLFGHYDAYADIMNENSRLYGENKLLRERVRDMKSATFITVEHPPPVGPSPTHSSRPSSAEKTSKTDKDIQVSVKVVDSGCDPHIVENVNQPVVEVHRPPSPKQAKETVVLQQAVPPCELTGQLERYQQKLCDLELELDKVKHELHNVTEKHEASIVNWQLREIDWMNQIAQNGTKIEELEQDLLSKNKVLIELQDANAASSRELTNSEPMDEIRIRMEKELVTLKVRLDHKEQTLRRSQQFLDEVRLEQLKMIEDHSQEVLNLQDTILEQQRALHRVEQTQREVAASAASSRAVVRHLETEADSSHQLHSQISDISGQLETVRKQAAQWKQAAEILSKEKQSLKESLMVDHKLVVEQLKSQWESSQLELKEQRDKVSDLTRQLNEERFDNQRSTLLQVLVAKLKTELDKKEKQMDFLKQLAEDMHSRLECAVNPPPLVTSTPVPTPITIRLPSPAMIETSPSKRETGSNNTLADLELQHTQLQKTSAAQRKQLELLRNQLKDQSSLVEKLQTEKGNLSRQMVSLRTRVTRLSGEKAAAQSLPDDGVCRLLKRIKELEGQLAMFHTAERPTAEDPQNLMVRNLAMDQWKERKKMQAVIDHLKLKVKDLQDRIQEDERQNESLRKTVNRLVNEKRVLEDKLKFKANDNERIHRLVEENTQWRIRFEGLERQLRELSEEQTDTNRHRLQISVLQERIRKQEQQISEMESKPVIKSTPNESVELSEDDKMNNIKTIEIKLRENIQRLVNLVQIPRRSNGEKRISFQDGPPMADIRRTVKTLHQLVCQLNDDDVG
ncbi:centrosomal protein of 290 kDa-like [Daphnia carinata]|uniref:centrosomal protein of 290 kDa-like n=1 Tax=Daphnia carinata TaxID=120202 RepID=UPI002579FFB2|nr:centrosomal protein of 290 kDa-like [Daphnia carinata]XP_057381410.1 centrosomal protein of 290 kDa-like [Daphnia carinata]